MSNNYAPGPGRPLMEETNAKLVNTVTYKVIMASSRLFGHVQLFATPWTVAHQAPLSMRLPRQEHWSGLLFPSPGDLPNPEVEPISPVLAGGFLTTH